MKSHLFKAGMTDEELTDGAGGGGAKLTLVIQIYRLLFK